MQENDVADQAKAGDRKERTIQEIRDSKRITAQ